MITSGYIGAPEGAPNAQAVQYDPTTSGAGQSSVTLLHHYYPIGTPLSRASWPNGVLPYVVAPGMSIMVPAGEAAALLAAGCAMAV